ncbi:MAG TPA: acetate--CoA ligase family protein [Stellaceae bacterium]|jgi:acetyltransferase|nr:acetate--CoA ligase family protein [Stellaceae bacterium]
MPDLRPLLSPDSVAIVGASADSSLRGRLTHQLIEHGYDGRIYPVTRSANEVLGHKAYKTIAELPEAVDLAVILVPAAHVIATIEQCGARGIKAAAVISSGFGEEKTEEAAGRDAELRAVAQKTGMVIAGPNCEGVVNPLRPLVATFSPVFHDPNQPLLPENSRAKPIAVSCQSGALTFAFLSRGRDRQLKFTYQVSAGNQTVLEAHDYVDWVLDAGGADIFMCYLEQIRDAARFRAVADRAAEAGKPIIVAKVGRSDAGRRAASSHTGALARAGVADDAIFRHHGIIRGEDLDHMVDVATAFAYCSLPKGNRVAIITGSGGSAVWMADVLSAHGLELPVLEDDIQRRIMALLPSYASALNPIDATAQAITVVGYKPLIELVQQSERIDTILLIGSLANDMRATKLAEDLADIVAGSNKPILLSTYTTASANAIAALAGIGIPCYTSMPSCARAIRALVDYGAFRKRLAGRTSVPATPAAARDEVARTLSLPGAVLTEIASKRLLGRYGIPLPLEVLAKSEEAAIAAAAKIGGPVALKVQSPNILHKTEAGAVALGVNGAAAVGTAYRQVLERAKAAHPDAHVEGVLVQAMARRGVEMIIGITTDPDFGPMLMVGLGGIHVEVLKDVAFAPVPLSPDEALDLVAQLKGAALLDGVRGAPPADKAGLAELISTLSRFAADHTGTIAEIDLNPVIVHPAGEGVTVVDALIVKR